MQSLNEFPQLSPYDMATTMAFVYYLF